VIVSSLLKMYGDEASSSDIKHEVDKLMFKFDKDNNGVLSVQEFIDGCLRDKELMAFFAPIVR
jgi:Ca2+-binding EF-hand superfamily protein